MPTYTIEFQRCAIEEATLEIEAKTPQDAIQKAWGVANDVTDDPDLDWEFVGPQGYAWIATTENELRQEEA